MDKVLRGIQRYMKNGGRTKFLADMARNAEPTAVMFSCIDCRVYPTKFLNPSAGDIFFHQSPGNMLPHYEACLQGQMSDAGGALELGIGLKGIRNVIVCGHSDCKAMVALNDMECCDHTSHHPQSPLMSWVAFHGQNTLEKARENETKPEEIQNVFHFKIAGETVTAVIDEEDVLSEEDKLSQVHVLQQASHVSSYPFLHDLIEAGELTVNALWFDVRTGNVFMFSREDECFVVMTDNHIEELLLTL